MASLEERVVALEAEVAELRDVEAIRRIIASYGPAVDTADGPERAQRLAMMWAEDGVYDIGGFNRHTGRADIASAFDGMHFEMVPNGCAHFMGTPVVRVDGDTATALAYSVVFLPEGDRFFVWRSSSNLWEFVRNNGKWRVSNRVNRLMNGAPETRAMLDAIGTISDAFQP